MRRSWMLFTSLFLSIAFLFWGCGRRSPVEESNWGDSSVNSGSSGSAGKYEGPDTPGAASGGTKYDSSDPRLSGHTQEWPEADARTWVEIQKQQIEALRDYEAYMKSKEAGNPDAALLQRAIQEFEQIETKLDPLINKYPDDRALSDATIELTTRSRALKDDLLVK